MQTVYIKDLGAVSYTHLFLQNQDPKVLLPLRQKLSLIHIQQEGVIEANVNLATNRAAVTFDPKVITIEQIIKSVTDTGYDCLLYTSRCV